MHAFRREPNNSSSQQDTSLFWYSNQTSSQYLSLSNDIVAWEKSSMAIITPRIPPKLPYSAAFCRILPYSATFCHILPHSAVVQVPSSSVDTVVQKMAEMASGICRLEAQLAETQVMAEVLRTMQTTLLLANQSSLRAEAEIERKAAEAERKAAEIEAYKLLILGLEDKIRALNEHVSAGGGGGGGGSNAKGGSVEEESNDDEDGDGDGSGDGEREGKKGGKQIYTMSRSIVVSESCAAKRQRCYPPYV